MISAGPWFGATDPSLPDSALNEAGFAAPRRAVVVRIGRSLDRICLYQVTARLKEFRPAA